MIYKLQKNRGTLLVLLIVSLILILPALIHWYPYPTISDDTPKYLQVITNVAHGDLRDSSNYRFLDHNLTGMSQAYRYAAPALIGLVVRVIHTDPYWTFYVFHYLALLAMSLAVWFFFTKIFNKITGYIGLIFVMFGATPVLRYFYYGEIFNLINLLIFGLMGVMAFIYWLKTNRFYYALISIMLFMISSIYHSSTGLEIYLCVGFFLVCNILYKAFRKAWKEVLGVGIYLSAFTILCGALIYFLSPESRSLLGGVISGASVSVNSRINSVVPVYYFFTQDTSLILLLFAGMAGGYLIKHRSILVDKARIGIAMLLSFIVVFVVSILLNRYEPARSAQDLGIILLLTYSAIIGTILYHYKEHPKVKQARSTIIFICLVASVPVLWGWFQYHCAITPIDQQAIRYMNSVNGSYSVSTQIQPEIYQLFIKNQYVASGGDYIIFRSKSETAATDPTNRYTIVKGNASKESDYDIFPRVKTFYSKDLTIVIYRQ